MWKLLLPTVFALAFAARTPQPIVNGCLPPLERRSGVVTLYVDDAASYQTGQTFEKESFDALPCDRIAMQVIVGDKFWNVTILNRYSCDCAPTSSCEPPTPWPLRPLNPFMITFTDVSTSFERPINTRRNTPLDPTSIRPTQLIVPDAVDRAQLTSNIRVTITFLPQATVSFCTGLITSSGLECFDDANQVGNPLYTGPKREFYGPALPRMGIQLSRSGQQLSAGNPIQTWTVNRKPPFPTFELSLAHECCGSPSPCPINQYRMQTSTGTFRAPTSLPALTGPCCNLDWPFVECTCFNYSATVTFYETVRLYSAEALIRQPNGPYNLSNPVSAALIPDPTSSIVAEGDAATVQTVGQYGMEFRFINYDLPLDGKEYNISTPHLLTDVVLPPGHTVLGLYILQPFPIKDLWVTVTDNNGTILFEEQEVHVPFIEKSAQGQVGWMFAVNHRAFSNALGVRVTASYNRRQSLGTTPEQQKSRLLINWLQDLSGTSWSAFVSPIPSTIIIRRGLLGAVAGRQIWSGSTIARVPYRAVLTASLARKWFEGTLGRKCWKRPGLVNGNTTITSNFTQLYWNLTFSMDPRAFDRLMLSLFAVLNGVNPDDRTSSWFAFFDSFYPARPTSLPWFYDLDALDRLLGFTEIPRLVRNKLEMWRIEWGILAYALPWFGREVSLYRWQNTRAWVMRNSFWNFTHYVMIPGVNLMRHGKKPNVNLIRDPVTNDYTLIAAQDLTKDSELFPNVIPSMYSKHEYLMSYGQTPDAAAAVATIPGMDGFLYNNAISRAQMVSALSVKYSESYKASLGRLLSLIGVKLGTLPLSIDGLGSDPETVELANAILVAERAVLTQQFADGTVEYESL